MVSVPFSKAAGETGEERQRHRRDGRKLELLQAEGRDRRREREHRADREVDVARRDHEGEPDAEDADLGEGGEHGEAVVEPGPEIRPQRQARRAKAPG